ncbi:hypothetical protein, partial [Thauera butanivorans]|uniref:hypothetical protein n=1 Tax=Thauera butanivorans TaxID=86174 RepID=UPI001C3F2A16
MPKPPLTLPAELQTELVLRLESGWTLDDAVEWLATKDIQTSRSALGRLTHSARKLRASAARLQTQGCRSYPFVVDHLKN